MDDRDYKVVYRSRGSTRDEYDDIDDRYDRKRKDKAASSDAYKPSFDGDYHRSYRDDEIYARDEISDTRGHSLGPRSSVTKTTYPVVRRREAEEAFVDVERSTRRAMPPQRVSRESHGPAPVSSRQNVVLDEGEHVYRSDRDQGRDSGSNRGRPVIEVEVGALGPKERRREYLSNERGSRSGGSYIVDARNSEVIYPGSDRGLGRADPRYSYGDDRPGRVRGHTSDRGLRHDPIDAGVEVLRRNVTPPPTAYRESRQERRSQSSALSDVGRDDEWRLVEPMRTTRLDSPSPRSSQADFDARPHSRRPTQSSEDSYIMVSPTQAPTAGSLRSALQRTDYPAAELHRRRSRSISFRDTEVADHDASERRHERPGAEARFIGRYLGKDFLDDASSVATERDGPRPAKRSGRDDRATVHAYDERDDRSRNAFPPQRERSPARRRESSRRRHRNHRDDDRSYYSDDLEETYVRESRRR